MPEIIYIMSDKRSGSTLLENILSKSDECFSVGELAMLKGHLIKEGPGSNWNYNCSCGKSFEECEFWSSVIGQVYTPKKDSFFTNINWNFKSKALAFNALFPFLFKNKFLKIVSNKNNRQVTATLTDLYAAIAEKSGKQFIVDSSKSPMQALAIYKNQTQFKVKIIWLKRDIRAIATSKRKWKEKNRKKEKSLLQLVMDIFYYRRLCYTVSKHVDKQDIIFMDYEDLAQQTHQQLQRIFTGFGLQPFATPEYMELVEDHTIGGTPGRFTKKPIQYDGSWKNQFKNNKLAYFVGGLLNSI